LASGGALSRGQIKIWDLNGGNQSFKTFNAGNIVYALVLLPNGYLASGSSLANGQIKICDTNGGNQSYRTFNADGTVMA
jgi:WD40 repeat protein